MTSENLEHKLKLLDDDAKHYPGNDQDGFFTTVDVTRCLDIKMETLQTWIKQGFIRPRYEIEGGRGMKKYFVKSQVAFIGVFERMVNFGIQRKYADTWARAFHNLRVDEKKSQGTQWEPLFVVIRVNESNADNVDQIALTDSNTPVRADKEPPERDFVVIDFKRILGKIEDYLLKKYVSRK